MKYTLLVAAFASLLFFSCDDTKNETPEKFDYNVTQFEDIKILRYQIPSWDNLTLKEQKLVYYLTQAGLEGRDIIWDQNYRHNLAIRKALEQIYTTYKGDKQSQDWASFETYIKRVWFANGIHHHYSNAKMKPAFSADYLQSLLTDTGATLNSDAFAVLFNDKDAKKVNLTKDVDNVLLSAVNFYGPGVTTADVENFYKAKISPDPKRPLSYGLNSQLVKQDGELLERVYKSGGLYGAAIDKIIGWLEKAKAVAENQAQGEALGILIEYYKTGDLQTWDDYNVAWTSATDGNIDYINSFIEVYNDPAGYRGSYETVVQIKDFEMSQKMAVLSENAQWFEDNSPLMQEHKKARSEEHTSELQSRSDLVCRLLIEKKKKIKKKKNKKKKKIKNYPKDFTCANFQRATHRRTSDEATVECNTILSLRRRLLSYNTSPRICRSNIYWSQIKLR